MYGLSVKDFIESAFLEDVGDGDHTSLAIIPAGSNGKAVVKIKENGIIAGLTLAVEILGQLDAGMIAKVLTTEGASVKTGDEVLRIEGNIQSLLKAERLLLNCMQRMSGIATKTNALVKMIEGTQARLLDTRKTTPNFRLFEKWAVAIGGGVNHRFGLFDMILIKDNHIDACGSIEIAIDRANDYLLRTGKNLSIEIETRSLEDVSRVLAHGNVSRILLDNFSDDHLRKAVHLVNHRFETEASGNITEETIRSVAETGVDFISVGALTHSYKSLDISMKITG
jgi:nicotinate-nucleotide pyrophosphorylase (carboxylating)